MKSDKIKRNTCIDCGKKITWYARRCQKCYGKYLVSSGTRKGKNNSSYIDGRSTKPNFCIDCGKQLSDYKAQRCKKCDGKQQSKRQLGRKMPPCSKETKKKISKAHKNKSLSEEHKRKISLATSGKSAYWYGKHRILETKQKISQTLMGQGVGKNNPNWKKGITNTGYGYTLIYNPKHPYAVNGRYVREHRLVVEKYLGRYLTKKEQVHHINEIKDDNRPENLMAFTSNSAHKRFHRNPSLVKKSEIVFDGRKIC